MLQCDLKGCEMNFDGEIVVYGQAGNFIYEVSRGILVDTKLSFDFSGRHEGCNFSGCCVTEKKTQHILVWVNSNTRGSHLMRVV